MTVKSLVISLVALAAAGANASASDGSYQVTSPDGSLRATVVVGSSITYTVSKAGDEIIAPSAISMRLSGDIAFGINDKVRKVVRRTVDQTVPTVVYKRTEVRDNFNEMELVFKEFSLIFRAYDEGVAYRFRNALKTGSKVVSEQAEFAMAGDYQAFVPYVKKNKGNFEAQYFNSFENTYEVIPVSSWDNGRMAFLPVALSADKGRKILITESDLLGYPGMYLYNGDASTKLTARFAPYPREVKQGGHNNLQMLVQSREDYIATAEAGKSFPWRIVMVVDNDIDLAVNDMVWKLATPDDGSDYSWVRPGKVAWDWWNDWNLYGVDFKTGVNNDTYKYYIDFAAAQGIEYVILDEGWAVNLQADLMQVVPEIDLQMLADYARERGVGLILWAGYQAFARDLENVCRHYSEMGFKGFKVDFLDRDDQEMVDFCEKAAKVAAKYRMMLDFHGAFKPAGLTRTYPNVVNFEGVHGLEQMKWSKADQVTYDVTVPYIRMAAGPMDYTQGAMRNATKGNYTPVYNEPMSQGTRCRQLAEYIIFESPLNMLCDSPSNYLAEPLCTRFIAEVPVVWDESVGLNGEIGKYISIARRSGDTWYAGSLTNWDARELLLDLSFLGEGNWTMEIFRDGANADKAARDFAHEIVRVPADRKVNIKMAPGGGWVARITR